MTETPVSDEMIEAAAAAIHYQDGAAHAWEWEGYDEKYREEYRAKGANAAKAIAALATQPEDPRIEQLEIELETVLDREAATYKRYDKMLDKAWQSGVQFQTERDQLAAKVVELREAMPDPASWATLLGHALDDGAIKPEGMQYESALSDLHGAIVDAAEMVHQVLTSTDQPAYQAIERIRQEEREACEKVAQWHRDVCGLNQDGEPYLDVKSRLFGCAVASDIAAAIRSRSDGGE